MGRRARNLSRAALRQSCTGIYFDIRIILNGLSSFMGNLLETKTHFQKADPYLTSIHIYTNVPIKIIAILIILI